MDHMKLNGLDFWGNERPAAPRRNRQEGEDNEKRRRGVDGPTPFSRLNDYRARVSPGRDANDGRRAPLWPHLGWLNESRQTRSG